MSCIKKPIVYVSIALLLLLLILCGFILHQTAHPKDQAASNSTVRLGSGNKPTSDSTTIFITTTSTISVTECLTPFDVQGECLPLKQCRIMTDYIKTLPDPISPETHKTLTDYYSCKEEHKVCCPLEGAIIPVSTANQNVAEPPSVMDHPNLYLLPKICGHYSINGGGEKIFEGTNADLNQFPWMALLSYYDTMRKAPRFNCGGTIINDRYILTAAHCITDLKFPLYGVRIGEYDINNRGIDCTTDENGKTKCSSPVQDMRIEKIIVHPHYNNETLSNDIGLLRLAKKINFHVDNAKPICLPIESNTKLPNFIIVTGWGYINDDAIASSILQQVRLPIIDHTQCQEKWKEEVRIGYKQLCTCALDGKGSCKGDSGGPLQMLSYSPSVDDVVYVQQGIVSFGPKQCGSNNIPEVHTRVVYYLDWILNEMEP